MNNTITYKCPNCNAGLIWDADNARFKCEYCISSFSREELDNTESAKKADIAMAEGECEISFEQSEEINENAQKKSEEYCSHMVQYVCSSCGADASGVIGLVSCAGCMDGIPALASPTDKSILGICISSFFGAAGCGAGCGAAGATSGAG